MPIKGDDSRGLRDGARVPHKRVRIDGEGESLCGGGFGHVAGRQGRRMGGVEVAAAGHFYSEALVGKGLAHLAQVTWHV
jgi:hypothetical protein